MSEKKSFFDSKFWKWCVHIFDVVGFSVTFFFRMSLLGAVIIVWAWCLEKNPSSNTLFLLFKISFYSGIVWFWYSTIKDSIRAGGMKND